MSKTNTQSYSLYNIKDSYGEFFEDAVFLVKNIKENKWINYTSFTFENGTWFTGRAKNIDFINFKIQDIDIEPNSRIVIKLSSIVHGLVTSRNENTTNLQYNTYITKSNILNSQIRIPHNNFNEFNIDNCTIKRSSIIKKDSYSTGSNISSTKKIIIKTYKIEYSFIENSTIKDSIILESIITNSVIESCGISESRLINCTVIADELYDSKVEKSELESSVIRSSIMINCKHLNSSIFTSRCKNNIIYSSTIKDTKLNSCDSFNTTSINSFWDNSTCKNIFFENSFWNGGVWISGTWDSGLWLSGKWTTGHINIGLSVIGLPRNTNQKKILAVKNSRCNPEELKMIIKNKKINIQSSGLSMWIASNNYKDAYMTIKTLEQQANNCKI